MPPRIAPQAPPLYRAAHAQTAWDGANGRSFAAAIRFWGKIQSHRGTTMALILSTLFWDKKVKIAILTLATFAALC